MAWYDDKTGVGASISGSDWNDMVTRIISSLTATSTVDANTFKIAGVTVTSSASELNILDGVTASAAELNIMDGVTASTAELNYTDGVTSNIQTQLDAKLPYTLVTPSSDHSYSGVVRSATAGETLAIGDLCYFKSDGKFWLADSDAEATSKGMLAIATAAISADAAGIFLLYGFYRDDTWNWTVGGDCYIHTTPGNPTQTKPSGAGDIVRIIGQAYSADVLFFNPDNVYIELT